MHFCQQDITLASLLAGVVSGCCLRARVRKCAFRVQYWWESMTSIERRDIVWFWIWVATVIGLSV